MLFKRVSRLFTEVESLKNHIVQSFNSSNDEPTKQNKNATTNNKAISQGFVKLTPDHPSVTAGGKKTSVGLGWRGGVALFSFCFVHF